MHLEKGQKENFTGQESRNRLVVDMVHRQRKKFKIDVIYQEKVYGKKSPMVQTKFEGATDMKDAKEWVAVLKKDRIIKVLQIKKLAKKDWY